jgi:hypothetical protein
MSLADIVNITINRETASVSRANFNSALILASHSRYLDRVRTYQQSSWAASMVADGFRVTDAAYLSMQRYFAPSVAPSFVKLGRMYQSVVTLVPVAANSTDYNIEIESVTPGTPTSHTITSDSSGTKAEITAALISAINGGAEASRVTASAGANDNLVITADGANHFAISTTTPTLLSINDSGNTNEGAATALAAIVLADSDWYGLLLADRSTSDAQACMAWTESNNRLFGYADSTAALKDSTLANDVTSLGYYADSHGYARSFVLALSAAETENAVATAMGRCFSANPGSLTWCFKSLEGVAVDTLTPTQQTNVWAKSANTYQTVSGHAIMQKGTTGSGEYIDVIQGVDWMTARIMEEVYGLLVRSDKVPFTDKGIARLEAKVRGVLEQATSSAYNFLEAFNPDLGDYFTTMKASDVSANDKALRDFSGGIGWSRRLAGAVHSMSFTGTVTY